MNTNTAILIAVIGGVIGLLLGGYRLREQRKRVKGAFLRRPDRPFPYQWRRILEEKVPFYSRLSSMKKKEFEDRVHLFLLNVQIVGVDTEATHEDRLLVAAGGIIPIFGFEKWHYNNLKVVEIYPDSFPIPENSEDPDVVHSPQKLANGLIGWGAMEGKMMLSRKALHHGFYDQSDNKNVAIHEFIHILDKQDGKIDGVLGDVMNETDLMPWLHLINHKISQIDFGDSSIRDYGAANKAEFLAVVSEFFFENPERLKSEHPGLYNALDSFFNPESENKGRVRYK